MALFESIAGNTFVALAIIAILPTIYIGGIIAALLLKSHGVFILRVADMVVALVFAPIVFLFAGPLGMIVGIVIIILGLVGLLGYFNIFKQKMDICLLSNFDPNICNFTCFIAIVLFMLLLVPETGIGVVIGLIILIVLIVILAVVLLPLLGGELAVTGGTRAAAGAGMRGAAPELLSEEGQMKRMMGEMAKTAGGRTAAVEGGAEKSAVGMVDEAKQQASQAAFQEAQEQAKIKTSAIQTEIDSATKDLELAEKIGDESRVKSLKKILKDKLAEKQKVQFPEAPEGKKGGFGRFGRIGGSEATGHIGGMMWFVIVILVIFGFIGLLMVWPSTSKAGQAGDALENVVISVSYTLVDLLRGLFDTILAWVVNTFVPCEVGNTGVICQTLRYRSCEPFCISQTGEAQWKGFEITQLQVVPSTVFDFQKFSILAEFTNNGEGEAIFTAVEDPKFGYYVSGNPFCQWGLGGFISDPTNSERCLKILPISQKQPNVQKLTSGKCALSGGEFVKECTLAPTDSTQIRWVGFEAIPGAIDPGKTVRSDIIISVPYIFKVPNDLVGTMTVQSAEEQLTAETTLKKEGQIAKKINKAYSPPGPLMMAMGTAERQVISGVPSLFIIQFANKGRGIVRYDDGSETSIKAENVRVYLPKGFEPMRDDLCDFEKWMPVSGLSKLPKEERDRWNPGPGYDDHTVYTIKNDLPAIIQTRTALETPTLYCVLKTPPVSQIKTFDFKARVLEYGYVESKRTSISITGTKIDPSGGGGSGGGTGTTESFKLSACQKGEWADKNLCNQRQVLDLGEEYDITKISASGKPGGDFGCAPFASVKFYASKDPSKDQIFVGESGQVARHTDGTASKVFAPLVKARYIIAQFGSSSGVGATCKYVDELSADITHK